MKHLLIFSSFAILTLSSCSSFFDSVVELEIPEHQPQLAITSYLATGDTAINVFVTRSRGALDQSEVNYPWTLDSIFQTGYYDTVQNVSVEVFRNDVLWATVPKFSGGWHRIEVPAIPADDTKYTLRVGADTYPVAVSTASLPVAVSLKEAIYTDGGIDEFGNRDIQLKVQFDDPAGQNYYRISVLFTDSLGIVTIGYLGTQVEAFNPNSFSDETFNGKSFSIDFNVYASTWGGGIIQKKMTVTLESVSQERYFFESSVEKNANTQGNPFAEPVIVRGNIEGGFGIFGTSSKSVKVIDL